MACAVADELPGTTASELSQRVWDALLRARDDRAAYDAFCVDARRLGESGLGWQELAPSAWSAAELALVAAGADSLPQERLEALAQEALRHVNGAPTEVAEALNAAVPPVSLTVGDEDGESQLDIPVDSHEERVAELLTLRQVIGELAPRDRSLVILRFFQNRTQTQTAAQLGMTQVQVSRREKVILREMRQKMTG